MKLNKIKKSHIIILILVILIIYGVYKNPDRRINKLNSEFEKVFQSSASDTQQLVKSISENKECLGPEAIKSEDHLRCVTNIKTIKNNFNTLNTETLKKYDEFYSSRNLKLDDETKTFLENAIKLYKSDSYSKLSLAYNDFFDMFIELHQKLSKGIKNMTPTEIENTRFIAENAGKSVDDLRLVLKDYNDYLNNNFDAAFVNMINQAGQSLKDSTNN